MEVTTALLCDFAQVREGLLFVSSGCVTHMWRDEFPAPMNVSLALVVELDQIEAERPHEIEVVVLGQDGERFAQVHGAFQIGVGGLGLGEVVVAPNVLPLHDVRLSGEGRYEVGVYIDGERRRSLPFRVAAGQPSGPG